MSQSIKYKQFAVSIQRVFSHHYCG